MNQDQILFKIRQHIENSPPLDQEAVVYDNKTRTLVVQKGSGVPTLPTLVQARCWAVCAAVVSVIPYPGKLNLDLICPNILLCYVYGDKFRNILYCGALMIVVVVVVVVFNSDKSVNRRTENNPITTQSLNLFLHRYMPSLTQPTQHASFILIAAYFIDQTLYRGVYCRDYTHSILTNVCKVYMNYDDISVVCKHIQRTLFSKLRFLHTVQSRKPDYLKYIKF